MLKWSIGVIFTQQVGEPNGGVVGEEGEDEGFVGEDGGLLALLLISARKSPQEVETGGGAGHKGGYAGEKLKWGTKVFLS